MAKMMTFYKKKSISCKDEMKETIQNIENI